MEHRACHLDTTYAISGQGSSSQETSHCRLGVFGQHMLRNWFTPKRNSVWPKAKVNSSLSNLALVPDQQSTLEFGICLDQWTQERSQAAQPFNTFKRQLISSISAQRQSQVVLMANADNLAGHRHQIQDAMADAAQGAFRPINFCPFREVS